MKLSFARFNIYLAAVLSLWLVAGCASPESKKKKAEKSQLTALSLHLEVNADGTDRNAPVPVFRDKPMYVNVDKEAFMDEGYILAAKVVDELGGFAIQLKFNWEGTGLLDGITTGNHNKRIAVLVKYDKESRWLAAPIIRRRISDGVFRFTPDATREEAERIVRGLNNVAKKVNDKDKDDFDMK